MEELEDIYYTIKEISIGEIYKEKGSKFVGIAFPVKTEEEIERFLIQTKNEHHKARHWCYAWQLGTEKIRFRANDDGEPNNSAGKPIYGQLLSKNVTNTLIIVVRYYGGVKLGVGGLISAYKTAAKYALESSIILTKTIKKEFSITFEYKDMNKVMRIIKENNLNILSRKMELNCIFTLEERKSKFEKVLQLFRNLLNVNLNIE